MTTGGLLVIAVTLFFTAAGWLLATYTKHQVTAHMAARDLAAAPSSGDETSVGARRDLSGALGATTLAGVASAAAGNGRVIVGASRKRRATIVHEG